MQPTLKDYTLKLEQDFPELQIRSIKKIGAGWHHDAVEVNGELVFRIPRGIHEADSTVVSEVGLLKALQGKLAVEIPEPLYVAPRSEYFGYKKVKGVLLKEVVNELDQTEQQDLRREWANLASSVHKAISVEEGRSLGLPNFIGPGPSAAERIFNMENVSQEVIEFANKTIRKSKELDVANIQYAVIHNDLQFHNIIASKETKKITGLIDWTDACIGPLAREFAISDWMKPGILEELSHYYEQSTGTKIDIEQARMWHSLEKLGDYVESTESGELEYVQDALDCIRNMISLES